MKKLIYAVLSEMYWLSECDELTQEETDKINEMILFLEGLKDKK
jgi:hypothetical protein